jgi:hypothetical protein
MAGRRFTASYSVGAIAQRWLDPAFDSVKNACDFALREAVSSIDAPL